MLNHSALGLRFELPVAKCKKTGWATSPAGRHGLLSDD